MTRTRPRAAVVLAAIGIAFAAAVVLGEVVARVVAPPIRYTMRGFELELDRDRLFRLAPGSSDAINASGYRDRPFDAIAAGAERRVVVLGDSFVMGYNVAVDETLPRALGRELGAGVAVFNLGVYGYGPDQALLAFEADGRALDPDVVVLVLFPANDFADLVKNRLVEPEAPELRWTASNPVSDALGGLALRRLIRRATTGSHLPETQERALFATLFYDSLALLSTPPDAVDRRAIAMARHVLVGLRDRLAADGVRLVVAVVPSFEAIEGTEWFESRDVPESRRLVNERTMMRILDALDIEAIDLAARFHDRREGPPLYDPEDHHFSVEGNRVVARELARVVADGR